ncbi:MAG: flagellin [Sphingomonadaceae bacterium]|nr:flagellin [Sphingomonadaceae bacterium]
MYALQSPHEAYRRVDFDARISGADPRQLVIVCYEQLVAALGAALLATERGDNARKSQALTRALAALTALQMGLDPGQTITAALATFLDGGRQTVLGSVVNFDPVAIDRLRGDVADLLEAFRHAPG